LQVRIGSEQTEVRDFEARNTHTFLNSDTARIRRVVDTLVDAQMVLVRENRISKICQHGIQVIADTSLSVFTFRKVIAMLGSAGIGTRRQKISCGNREIVLDMDMFYLAGDYNNERGLLDGARRLTIETNEDFQFVPSSADIRKDYSGAIDVVLRRDLKMGQLMDILAQADVTDAQFIRLHEET
jgi:hypothetical protein